MHCVFHTGSHFNTVFFSGSHFNTFFLLGHTSIHSAFITGSRFNTLVFSRLGHTSMHRVFITGLHSIFIIGSCFKTVAVFKPYWVTHQHSVFIPGSPFNAHIFFLLLGHALTQTSRNLSASFLGWATLQHCTSGGVYIPCIYHLIIFVCGIVVFICVCSIARTGC